MKRAKNSKQRAKKKKIAKELESPSVAAEARRLLFVDPASISSGWALYVGKTLRAHGTVRVNPKGSVFARLAGIWDAYRSLDFAGAVDQVHIESLPRLCHHYTHFSVGVIGHALTRCTFEISGDVPVRAWQKFVGWDGKKGDKYAAKGPEFLHPVDSEDERAAIAMGYFWVNTR